MTVYLGDHGVVELKRASSAPIHATVKPGDVSLERRRFSFKDDVRGELITGDQVDILNQEKAPLQFIKGHRKRDWRGFVYVDIMGGLRLYSTFDAAVRGDADAAVELAEPSQAQNILIQTRNSRYEHLAQVKSFEFTTERETVDTTVLSDQFRKRYEAGLISGQGRLECFWDHKHELCDPHSCAGAELPVYLAQLCIRLTQGADFFGRFFIYTSGGADPRDSDNAVWYEAECIVTNVSITVSPTEIIESSIDFVTTGTIKLLIGHPPSYLLTEEPAKLLLEDGSGILLAPLD